MKLDTRVLPALLGPLLDDWLRDAAQAENDTLEALLDAVPDRQVRNRISDATGAFAGRLALAAFAVGVDFAAHPDRYVLLPIEQPK